MESEGSLLCSQQPTNGPYPDSDESSSHHHIISIRYILKTAYLRLGIHSSVCASRFPTTILCAFLTLPVLHAPPTSFSLI